MRISSNNFYDNTTLQLNNLQANITNLSTQISTGKNNITPIDDPSSMVQILNLNQQSTYSDQLVNNRTNLKNTLGSMSTALSSMQNTMQSINEQIVALGNGSLSASDKTSIANLLKGQLNQLTSLVNSDDGAGHYLFSGSNNSVPPLSTTTIPQSSNNIAYDQFNYQDSDQFGMVQVLPGALNKNTTVSLDINANSIFGKDDSSGNNNFLNALSKTIGILSSPTQNSSDVDANVKNLANLFGSTFNRLVNSQSKIGTIQNNLDSYDQLSTQQSAQTKQTLSSLQDTNYNKVLSDLAHQQLQLQAAQKSFQQISSLSLFNYIQ